ncbi:MAG: LiaI-LiaF-like domain-containing protein [Anaerolineae bacterium]
MTEQTIPAPRGDDRRSRRHRGGFFFPLLLVGIGLVLLLNNLGITNWSGWDIVARGWPVLVIAMGLDLLVRRDGYVTGVVLAGIGVAALLNTTGVWQWDMLRAAVRYWPLLLIAMGVDIFVTKPASVGALIGVLPGVIGIVALAWFIGAFGSDDRTIETRTISQPLPAVSSASIDIEPIAGSLRIRGLRTGDMLISGPVALSRGERVEESLTTSGGRAAYTLASRGAFAPPAFTEGDEQRWHWDLQVAADLPITLSTTMVAGESSIDLSGVAIDEFKIETVFGETYVVLPVEGAVDGSIDGIVGSIEIVVPTGLAVRVEADSLIGDVEVPADFDREGGAYVSPGYAAATSRADIVVNQLVGSVTVRYEQG